MSILDKQLPNTPIHPSRRKPILIISALLALLVLVFACSNVSAAPWLKTHAPSNVPAAHPQKTSSM